MRSACESLLRHLAQIPGVQVAGVCLPDRTTMSFAQMRSAAPDPMWKAVQESFSLLKMHRLPARTMCWRYPNHAVQAAFNRSGAALAVVVRAEAPDVQAREVADMCAQFCELPLD